MCVISKCNMAKLALGVSFECIFHGGERVSPVWDCKYSSVATNY